MNTTNASPTAEDVVSVGSRINWGAILAGVFVALGLYFLLGTLGAAAGISLSDRVNDKTLESSAITWAFLSTASALFVGGVVTSLFTVGENKMEAMVYGLIMWATLFTLLLILGGMGVKGGMHAMHHSNNGDQSSWESAARNAGVPADKIDEWRNNASQKDNKETAKRAGWYAFFATWLSMLAAAIGGRVGAGPTFRLVTVNTVRR